MSEPRPLAEQLGLALLKAIMWAALIGALLLAILAVGSVAGAGG